MVVEPGSREAFAAAGLRMMADAAGRSAMGARGRAHAERAYDVERVADRFEEVMAAARAAEGRAVTRQALVFQLFVLIYLQRLAVPVGGLAISLPLIATGAALAALAATRRLTFSRTRLVLFAVMGASAALSQAVVRRARCRWRASRTSWRSTSSTRCGWRWTTGGYAAVWRAFAALMVVPAVLVVAQYGWQLREGPGSGLGLDFLFPRRLLLPGYVYQSSSEAWRTWDRPNGVFFLEPSFCSAFLALAFLNEALWLRRRGLAALFLAALILCSGATGLMLVAIAIGWRLRHSRSAMLAIAATGLALVALIDSQLATLGRLAELSRPGSSGYERLVLPLASFYRLVGDPGGWLAGHGAGQITADFGNAWPMVKLTYEYGLPTAVAWLALFVAAIGARENAGVRIAVFVVFQFTGGYLLSPIMVLFVALACSMCAVSAERAGLATGPRRRGFAKPPAAG